MFPASVVGTSDRREETYLVPGYVLVLKSDVEDISLHLVMSDAVIFQEWEIPYCAVHKIRRQKRKGHAAKGFISGPVTSHWHPRSSSEDALEGSLNVICETEAVLAGKFNILVQLARCTPSIRIAVGVKGEPLRLARHKDDAGAPRKGILFVVANGKLAKSMVCLHQSW